MEFLQSDTNSAIPGTQHQKKMQMRGCVITLWTYTYLFSVLQYYEKDWISELYLDTRTESNRDGREHWILSTQFQWLFKTKKIWLAFSKQQPN